MIHLLTNFRIMEESYLERRVDTLQVSYKKLWKLLIDKELTQTDMYRMSGISSGSMTKLRKGQSVSIVVLWKICSTLDCNIGDVIEFIR